MPSPESLFNPDEYLSKTEISLTQKNIKLLQEKADELRIDFKILLEIAIVNYKPVTKEEIDYYNNLGNGS